jgi:hypothetical protein
MTIKLADTALHQALRDAGVKVGWKFREARGPRWNDEFAGDTFRMTAFERGHQPTRIGCLLYHRTPLPAQFYYIVQVHSGMRYGEAESGRRKNLLAPGYCRPGGLPETERLFCLHDLTKNAMRRQR